MLKREYTGGASVATYGCTHATDNDLAGAPNVRNFSRFTVSNISLPSGKLTRAVLV